MEDNKKVLLSTLVEKRRVLNELRSRVIIARGTNESDDDLGNQNYQKKGEDSNISICHNTNSTEQVTSGDLMEDQSTLILSCTLRNTPYKPITGGLDEQVNLDYDSDDSVLDKNYEPNKDDYSSSCSEISNSPIQTTSTRNLLKSSQVKRRIFSPDKLDENNGRSSKRNISSLYEHDPPVNMNDSELVTLEDLIGPLNNVKANPSNFSSPTKKPCLDKVIVNVNENGDLSSDSDNEESFFSSLRIQGSKALVPFQPNNSDVLSVTSSATGKNEISSGSKNLYHNTNTPAYEVLAVDCDGTIYLPHLINNCNASGAGSRIDSKMSQKGKTKIANPSKWIRNISKTSRLKGSPYHSTAAKKNIEVEGRMLKAPCSCTSKCYLKITEDQRQLIHYQFWKQCKSWDQRRQFIVSTVRKDLKRTMKTSGNLETDRRKFSYTYTLEFEGFEEKVCKVMYMNTLSIREKFITVSMEKKQEGGLIIGDQRGKHDPANKSPKEMIKTVIDHIKSYPSYESHYAREKSKKKYLGSDLNIATMYAQYKIKMEEEETPENLIAKEWIYRRIFHTEFNLSFKLPSIDTCDDCDAYQNKLKTEIDETKRKEIEEEHKAHIKLAEERYILKKKDKEEATNNSQKKKVLMYDLQKCLATPNLTNTKSFYMRKLWTLNLTMFDATENTATNLVWSENISERGGNEIASCLLRWADENRSKIASIEELTFWSDNCAGQNRNFMIVTAYIWMLGQFTNLKVINHKFMLKGHTHMEVDQIHAQIERKKRQLKTMQIAIPRDWSQFIRTCGGGKRNFNVFDMTLADFKDLTSLYKRNGPLVQRKKNKDGNDFKISECVFLQLRREHLGVLFYKETFSGEFNEISLIRNVAKGCQLPAELPAIRNDEKPISSAKYKDLMSLLQWVPLEFHGYYKKLKHNDNETDFPEAD